VNLRELQDVALKRGLALKTEEDCLKVLLTSGLSLSSSISDLSGRGIGLGAILGEAEKLGGGLKLVNHPGHGFELNIWFNKSDLLKIAEQ
jgi:two-component system chemotaxis sensor kinase CheA